MIGAVVAATARSLLAELKGARESLTALHAECQEKTLMPSDPPLKQPRCAAKSCW